MSNRTIKTCSIEGCDNTLVARGWCNKHYRRWKRHGNPTAGVEHFDNPYEAFSRFTKPSGNCLLWTRHTNEKGYGFITDYGTTTRVHRWVWEQHNGEIPDGFVIDHLCWNTNCVKISHLRLATNTDNVSYRKSANTNSHSGYRNIYPYNDGWRVQIKKNRVAHHFGVFATIEEAAVVAEQARKDLFGDYAGRG